MTDCSTESDCRISGHKEETDETLEAENACDWEVASVAFEEDELAWINNSAVALYCGVMVSVHPTTAPTTTQNRTISVTQCFLTARSTLVKFTTPQSPCPFGHKSFA